MTATRIVEDLAEAEALAAEWDALVVAARRPMNAPAWMLAWWRHVAPPSARLRIVEVRDDDGRLAGVAPYFVDRGPGGRVDCRLLASGISHRVRPIARAGDEARVARAAAPALAASRPRPDLISFEGSPAEPPWRQLFVEALGGRLRCGQYVSSRLTAPHVTLTGQSFEEWLAGRSRNFRAQHRKMLRRFAAAGGRVRLSDHDTLDADLAAFAALHTGRWHGRGGSTALQAGVEDMLREAARRLLADDRLRIFVAERDGRPIAVDVLVAAGGDVVVWNGGWDEAQADLRPGQVLTMASLEYAFARGDAVLDLGGGTYQYKQRIADTRSTLEWGGVLPLKPRMPLTRAQLLPRQARVRLRAMAGRLPDERQAMLRRALHRLHR